MAVIFKVYIESERISERVAKLAGNLRVIRGQTLYTWATPISSWKNTCSLQNLRPRSIGPSVSVLFYRTCRNSSTKAAITHFRPLKSNLQPAKRYKKESWEAEATWCWWNLGDSTNHLFFFSSFASRLAPHSVKWPCLFTRPKTNHDVDHCPIRNRVLQVLKQWSALQGSVRPQWIWMEMDMGNNVSLRNHP